MCIFKEAPYDLADYNKTVTVVIKFVSAKIIFSNIELLLRYFATSH